MNLTYIGQWNNTSSNITSLLIKRIYLTDGVDAAAYGTFTGKIRLWKKLPLNNE